MSATSLPQPDVSLRISPEYGGRSKDERTHAIGIPELAVEICEDSAAYDLGPKLRVYEKAGVPEYITMLLDERQIMWRELFEGALSPDPPDADGLLRSGVFPGATHEHAEFVRNLASRKR